MSRWAPLMLSPTHLHSLEYHNTLERHAVHAGPLEGLVQTLGISVLPRTSDERYSAVCRRAPTYSYQLAKANGHSSGPIASVPIHAAALLS